MDEEQNRSLFGLNIDAFSKQQLSEAARWARFLAIIGFIFCGLILCSLFFASTSTFTLSGFANPGTYNSAPASQASRIISGTLFAAIYFFPCLFLFRWSSKMKTALAASDQDQLNGAFQNLKIFFRYVGILTVIGLALVGLAILFVLLGVGLAGR